MLKLIFLACIVLAIPNVLSSILVEENISAHNSLQFYSETIIFNSLTSEKRQAYGNNIYEQYIKIDSQKLGDKEADGISLCNNFLIEAIRQLRNFNTFSIYDFEDGYLAGFKLTWEDTENSNDTTDRIIKIKLIVHRMIQWTSMDVDVFIKAGEGIQAGSFAESILEYYGREEDQSSLISIKIPKQATRNMEEFQNLKVAVFINGFHVIPPTTSDSVKISVPETSLQFISAFLHRQDDSDDNDQIILYFRQSPYLIAFFGSYLIFPENSNILNSSAVKSAKNSEELTNENLNCEIEGITAHKTTNYESICFFIAKN